jgi:MFS family permease
MQSMALQWLVWRLTHSAVALVLVAFLGQFPVALLGVVGGSVADRYPRRTVLLVTQFLAMLQAGVLAVLTLVGLLGTNHVLIVYLLAAGLGVVSSFDLPARQALLAQVAGEEVESAVALNSSIFNGARLLGPALAGVLVTWVGEGVCFLLNALSYGCMLFGLWRMDLTVSEPAPPCGGNLAEGVRFAARSERVRTVLTLLAVSSVFGWSCLALAPVFASRLGGQASFLGVLLAAVGLGSLVGATALLVAQRGAESLQRRVAWGATILGVGLGFLAASQHRWTASVAMLLIGFGFTQHLGATNTLLHVLSPPPMRGRVMGIFLTAFIGISPLGGLVVGWLATKMGEGIVVSAASVVVITASAFFRGALSSQHRRAHGREPLLKLVV